MWLQDLHFEEYYHLFEKAGYEMCTVARMTPEVCGLCLTLLAVV